MTGVRLSKKQKADLANFNAAELQYNRYRRARDGGHTDYLEIARRCNEFYRGEQWRKKDIKKLEAEGKPWLTINLVLASVNTILGEQKSRRVEFKYKPSLGGTESTATVMTKIVQAIKDANKYDYKESQVFSDGVIDHGRGFFDVRMRFDQNIRGDVWIQRKDPRNIILDPDAKEYEPETWTEVFETRWASIDDIAAKYGQEKADKIATLAFSGSRFDHDSIQWEDETFGDAREKEGVGQQPTSNEEDTKSIRRVRIVERQSVKYEPCQKFVDPINGDTKLVPPTWDDKRAQAFAVQHDLFIVRGTDRKIRWTATADRVVLHDDWSPYRTFTIIPYFCYFRSGKPFGVVTNLLSPQEQLNKLSSQELHIVNTTANSGWVVEEGTLAGMTVDELRHQGSETGLVITVRKGALAGIEKIKPNQVPTGIDRLATKAGAFIKEISGVNEALLGQENPEISGVALERNEFRGIVQLQVPFDNLDLTRRLMSEKILELVQQFYTEERVFHITTDGLDFEDPQNEDIIINAIDGTGKVVNDVTVGKYDTVLAMFPSRDSFNDSQFAEALNLRKIGVVIPDDRIIEYSHLSRKDKLAKEVRDMTGRGEKTEQQIAIEQFMQQTQLRLMAAEAAQAEAEVAKTEAEIAKAMAEAQMKGGGMDSPEYRLKMNELEAKLIQNRENAQLRRDLAQLSATSQLDLSVMGTQGKLITDTNAKREERKTAMLTLASKPPTPTKRT